CTIRPIGLFLAVGQPWRPRMSQVAGGTRRQGEGDQPRSRAFVARRMGRRDVLQRRSTAVGNVFTRMWWRWVFGAASGVLKRPSSWTKGRKKTQATKASVQARGVQMQHTGLHSQG
ncbi:unnamed protein product, partial [Pylaiella littoralis]